MISIELNNKILKALLDSKAIAEIYTYMETYTLFLNNTYIERLSTNIKDEIKNTTIKEYMCNYINILQENNIVTSSGENICISLLEKDFENNIVKIALSLITLGKILNKNTYKHIYRLCNKVCNKYSLGEKYDSTKLLIPIKSEHFVCRVCHSQLLIDTINDNFTINGKCECCGHKIVYNIPKDSSYCQCDICKSEYDDFIKHFNIFINTLKVYCNDKLDSVLDRVSKYITNRNLIYQRGLEKYSIMYSKSLNSTLRYIIKKKYSSLNDLKKDLPYIISKSSHYNNENSLIKDMIRCKILYNRLTLKNKDECLKIFYNFLEFFFHKYFNSNNQNTQTNAMIYSIYDLNRFKHPKSQREKTYLLVKDEDKDTINFIQNQYIFNKFY